jgi:streptomycin 6-kinase
MDTLRADFVRTILELHGAVGDQWLGRLPSIIADCVERWSLMSMSPFESLSYNLVASAVRADGTEVVLKAGVPGPELQAEIEALRLFNGHGAVQLLEADAGRGVLLLERLKPGTPLSSVPDDEQATSIAGQVMRQLWRPLPLEYPFPTVEMWAAGLARLREQFGGGSGPFPSDLVDKAETLFAQLLGSMAEPVLLHGDLHHQNIVAAERQPWLALDPKGLVGEPAYEVGALLRNPMPQLLAESRPTRILARRADLLAGELGFDRDRLVGWGQAQAVLAGWWSYEDYGHGWERWIACAEILSTLE